jgi:hypothetical protein
MAHNNGDTMQDGQFKPKVVDPMEIGLDVAAAVVQSMNSDDPFKKVLDVGKDVSGGIVDGVKHAANKIAAAGGSIVHASKKDWSRLKRLTNDQPLGGNSKYKINSVLIGVAIFVTSTCLIVFFVEKMYPRVYAMLNYPGPASKRPALWVLTLILQAYILLIPGLFQVLFSFKVGITLLGFHIIITSGPHGNPHPLTESTVSVIQLLYETGGWLGAGLVTFYAIVVPLIKIICLGLGEYWRASSDPNEVRRSRSAILFVQYISKWACPDMFAYLLLLYLLRHLPEHSAGLIEAPAKLDIGFSCFAIFCVMSTFTSLAIEPPECEKDPDAVAAASAESKERTLSPKGIFILTILFVSIFTVLLGIGLGLPVMGLEVDKQAILAPRGPVPDFLSPVLDYIHISEIVNSQVPVWDCISALSTWAWQNAEGNCLLGLVMLLVFAVIFPCLDMFLLLWAAYDLYQNRVPNAAMSYAKVVGKISMLDVFCMGVIVVTLAAGMYHRMGVNVFLEQGIWLLIGAEVVHYITFWMVQSSVDDMEERAAIGSAGAAAEAEEDPAEATPEANSSD